MKKQCHLTEQWVCCAIRLVDIAGGFQYCHPMMGLVLPNLVNSHEKLMGKSPFLMGKLTINGHF